MHPHPQTELTLLVFELHQALLNEGDRRIEAVGLTSARWKILGALALSDEPLTAPRIGERMGLSRQGAQKQLNALLEEGLLESRDNAQHRRSRLYALTAEGARVYADAERVWQEWSGGWEIPESDLRLASAVLHRVLDAVRAGAAG